MKGRMAKERNDQNVCKFVFDPDQSMRTDDVLSNFVPAPVVITLTWTLRDPLPKPEAHSIDVRHQTH
jgi:hypothetical protein